jgi:Rieske Fe-S protein
MSQDEVCIKTRQDKKDSFKQNRRSFIKTAALAGGATLITGVPLASYFIAPALKKGTGKWVDFGSVEDLEPDSVAMLSYEFLVKDGWLVLPQRGFVWAKTEADDKVTVFSSICTHLSCNVIWREETKVFDCPCHAGRFDIMGQPIAGPPTKPLKTLDHKVEDDNLLAFLTF